MTRATPTHSEANPEENPDYSRFINNTYGNLPLQWLESKTCTAANDDEQDATNHTTTPKMTTAFLDLKHKTHHLLYGNTTTSPTSPITRSRRDGVVGPPPPHDKSPKGSVDRRIHYLVDLINTHAEYCTLSSCSGRISLFDPNNTTTTTSGTSGTSTSKTKTNADEDTRKMSGKGQGRWVIVSHDKVHPNTLVEALRPFMNNNNNNNHENNPMTKNVAGAEVEEKEEEDTAAECEEAEEAEEEEEEEQGPPPQPPQPWTFRFEPLLLHVGAASVAAGRILVTIALNLGFRESGLLVTDKRVTVAIRSYALSTITPLVFFTTTTTTSIVPSSLVYVRALLEDANTRLEQNWRTLQKLYRTIEDQLFRIRTIHPPITITSSSSSNNTTTTNTNTDHYSGNTIPALKLWNCCATAITTVPKTGVPTEQPATKIWILGGYGCGPTLLTTASTTPSTAAKRSSVVYQLEQTAKQEPWEWVAYQPPSPLLASCPTGTTRNSTTSASTSTTTITDKKERLDVVANEQCNTENTGGCSAVNTSTTNDTNNQETTSSSSPSSISYLHLPYYDADIATRKKKESNTTGEGKRRRAIMTLKIREEDETTRCTNHSRNHKINNNTNTNTNTTHFPDVQGMESCHFHFGQDCDDNDDDDDEDDEDDLPFDLVVFWGGRKSPARPVPATTLYVATATAGAEIHQFGIAMDIRGTIPSPRWGHQFVVLDDADDATTSDKWNSRNSRHHDHHHHHHHRAVLMGGCNLDDGALDDMFILHLRTEQENENNDNITAYFYWERLSLRLPTPRFHFCSTLLKRNTVLIVGGLQSTTQLLQPFEQDEEQDQEQQQKGSINCEETMMWACRFGNSTTKRMVTTEEKVYFPITQTIMNITIDLYDSTGGQQSSSCVKDIQSLFGAACCTVMSKNLLVITGGIKGSCSSSSSTTSGTSTINSRNNSSSASPLPPPLQAYWISDTGDNYTDDRSFSSSLPVTVRLQRIALGYNNNTAAAIVGAQQQPQKIDRNLFSRIENGRSTTATTTTLVGSNFDFGSMVHHCCIPLTDIEFILIGGGVPSFAFGESYAKSHHIIINTNNHDEDTITVDRAWTGTTLNQATILDDKGKLQQTTAAVTPNKITAMTNVVYVLPKHAKYVQNILRTKCWLDKRYRMIKISLLIENKEEGEVNVSDDVQRDAAVPNDKFCADANKTCTTQRQQLVIAVPISSVSFKEITTVCGDVYILERGQREMPFSTSQYASKVK